MIVAREDGSARSEILIRPIGGSPSFVDVGSARHWEILTSIWSRYQRVQMPDRDIALCVVAHCLAGYGRPEAVIRRVVSDNRVSRIDRHMFVETAVLEELRAGCVELELMIDSDVAGSFRFNSAEPLLSTQEERIVRWVIRTVDAAWAGSELPLSRRADQATAASNGKNLVCDT